MCSAWVGGVHFVLLYACTRVWLHKDCTNTPLQSSLIVVATQLFMSRALWTLGKACCASEKVVECVPGGGGQEGGGDKADSNSKDILQQPSRQMFVKFGALQLQVLSNQNSTVPPTILQHLYVSICLHFTRPCKQLAKLDRSLPAMPHCILRHVLLFPPILTFVFLVEAACKKFQ